MKSKVKILISVIALIVSGMFLYDFVNRGTNCGGGKDDLPMTIEEKQYRDSVTNAQSAIVQQRKDSVMQVMDNANFDREAAEEKLRTLFIGKWQALWLLDNKTNKTFEHILQKEENGYIMRMPVPIKGKQNTRMRKKLNKNQPPTGVLQKWGICTKFKHSTSN
jgi:hypothetical protein